MTPKKRARQLATDTRVLWAAVVVGHYKLTPKAVALLRRMARSAEKLLEGRPQNG